MVDIGVVVDGSKMVVEVNAAVDIGVVAAGLRVTMVDPPGMIEQTRGRQNRSSKVPPVVIERSPQLLPCGRSSHSRCVVNAYKLQ